MNWENWHYKSPKTGMFGIHSLSHATYLISRKEPFRPDHVEFMATALRIQKRTSRLPVGILCGACPNAALPACVG